MLYSLLKEKELRYRKLKGSRKLYKAKSSYLL